MLVVWVLAPRLLCWCLSLMSRRRPSAALQHRKGWYMVWMHILWRDAMLDLKKNFIHGGSSTTSAGFISAVDHSESSQSSQAGPPRASPQPAFFWKLITWSVRGTYCTRMRQLPQGCRKRLTVRFFALLPILVYPRPREKAYGRLRFSWRMHVQ